VTSYTDGGYLIADTGHNRVLRVTPAGDVEVVAGAEQAGYSGDGGPAAEARLNRPTQVVAAAGGTVLVADTGNGAVRRVLASGLIETVTRGLNEPEGVLGLPDGGVIIASAEGLNRVAPDGSLRRIAGGTKRGYNGDRGPGAELLFDGLGQIALAADGRILFAERGSDRIRALDASETVETVAGSGEPMPEPTVGIPAGAFPPELSSAGAARAAPRSALSSLTAAAAGTSPCEAYDARFASFSLVPQTDSTLRVTSRRSQRGRSQIRLRFAMSVAAAVVVEVTRAGKPGGRKIVAALAPGRHWNRIRVGGHFARGTYVARLFGVSLKDRVRRCDVKFLRVR
jgi:hypothetical protein